MTKSIDSNRSNKPARRPQGIVLKQLTFNSPTNSNGKLVVICFDENGNEVYPRGLRFKPLPGREYHCRVQYFSRDDGTCFGKAEPSREELVSGISPSEWLPPKEYLAALDQTLLFWRGHRSPVAQLPTGEIVVPDNGCHDAFKSGNRHRVLLREHPHRWNLAFAIPHPQTASASASSERGLVLVGLDAGILSDDDLTMVPQTVIKGVKEGVAETKSEEDLVTSARYVGIYDILSWSDRGIVVNADSSEDEIKRAYTLKRAMLSPDRVAHRGNYVAEKRRELLIHSLDEAMNNALALITRKQLRAQEAAEAPAAAPATEANAPVAAKSENTPEFIPKDELDELAAILSKFTSSEAVSLDAEAAANTARDAYANLDEAVQQQVRTEFKSARRGRRNACRRVALKILRAERSNAEHTELKEQLTEVVAALSGGSQ